MCHNGDGQRHISRENLVQLLVVKHGRLAAISQVFSFDMTNKPLASVKQYQSMEELVWRYLVPAKCGAVGCASHWGDLGHLPQVVDTSM